MYICLQMGKYLNGPLNKMEAHLLFGVLNQLGMDLDTAHKENADRDAKVGSERSHQACRLSCDHQISVLTDGFVYTTGVCATWTILSLSVLPTSMPTCPDTSTVQAAKAAAKAKHGAGTTTKRSASTGSLPPKAQVLSHIKAYGRLKPTEAK
jgi:hypothetical protein